MSDFLHGVETTVVLVGGTPITVVKTAVVMLIGYAPLGDKQKLILVQKDSDFSQFGAYLYGFTIPQSLVKIFKKGAGTVIVNNLYDTAVNDVTVTSEALVLVGGKGSSAFHPTNAVVVKDTTSTTTYVKDTDYSIDAYGNITVIGTTIAQNAPLKLTYKKFDSTTVNSAAIAGAVTGDVRTGLKLFDEAKTTFGFAGKILICPVYCGIAAVATEMVSYINDKRACTLIHAPYGTTKAVALAGRGVSGAINFQTKNKRVKLLYPYAKDFSLIDGSAASSEPSAYWAGVMCNSDLVFGPQRSESNQEIIGVNGTEIKLTDELNDKNSDANLLNGAGIATISMGSGTALTWGNRNASFPDNQAVDSFLSVIRISDIVAEAIEYYSRPKIDGDVLPVNIDTIRDDVNAFMKILISRGWLVVGSECTFDPAKNPALQVAAGWLKFDYKLLPPPPLERLSYIQTIDVQLAQNIVSAVA